MALMDKHKVKRQRLDRICEGKEPWYHSAALNVPRNSWVAAVATGKRASCLFKKQQQPNQT
ncbi:unnamed protein product [Oncorhynchus mykiss]|uniref:Uncharacterized protein n=1 Tax=Oncorhynchus mykiss TaxID=8022 RepID=A0A060XRH7_ONCMY|nr:unnamed protein product [Oncorhynchus mykiss]